MKNLKSRFLIKVPKSISLIYCLNRQVLCIKNSQKSYLLDLKLKLRFIDCNTFYITNQGFASFSSKDKNNLKRLRGTTRALINKIIYQATYTCFKKLKLVGVGFKVLQKTLKNCNLEVIEFRLGYSHSIFFKVPKNVSIMCHKSNNIFIIGTSVDKVAQTASIIRNYKVPEVYKGKGILYQNEIITLKQGKKV